MKKHKSYNQQQCHYLSSNSGPVVAHVLLLIDEAVLVHDPLPQVPVVHLHLVGGQTRRLEREALG